MIESVFVTGSTPLTRVLAVSSQAGAWASLDAVLARPSGTFNAGHDGMFAPESIKLIPICEGGQAGSQFSVRLYAWDALRSEPTAQQPPATWIPTLLAEFLCTVCNRSGPYPVGSPTTGAVLTTENFCDTIALTQGTVGQNGLINSTGPGTDLIAYVKIDLAGCRLYQFDFVQTDTVGMNCLWSRC